MHRRQADADPADGLAAELTLSKSGNQYVRDLTDSDGGTIRGRFLSEEDRSRLIAVARDGSAASRVTRRADALVLLNSGWSCRDVADALLLNDDTIRSWLSSLSKVGSRA